MIDPYLKINVQGVVKTSSKKHNTKDPMYYESYDFPIEIVHANGLQLAPRVSILLWDYDWGIMDGDDDYCGCCFIDIKVRGGLRNATHVGFRAPWACHHNDCMATLCAHRYHVHRKTPSSTRHQ